MKDTNEITIKNHKHGKTYFGKRNAAIITNPIGATFTSVRFYESEADLQAGDLALSFRRDFRNWTKISGRKQAEIAATIWANMTRGVTVWDNGGATADRYRVIINTSVYYMSKRANQPNGVCMYSGETFNNHENTGDPKKRIALGDLPLGVASQIGYLIYAEHEHLEYLKEIGHVQ